MSPYENVGAGAAGILVVWLLIYFGAVIFSIVSYVLHSLGLYTIANRRQIKHPWLAWLPVAQLWTLGSISDQYKYVTKGKVCNKRKTLIGLSIAVGVMYIVFWVGYIMALVNMFMHVDNLGYMGFEQSMEMFGVPILIIIVAALAMLILAIVLAVFEYIAYYDLFASSNPENASVFIVLSILFNFTLPFFVFGCRKRDLGMPPKKSDMQPQRIEAAVAEPVKTPVEEPAPAEEPVPAEETEE